MPASSLLALIDDIATTLDDVAVMTKVATKKTAGVLGDDLALNAQQVSGLTADRELPVVFAVAKGSAVNKAILVPLALLIANVVPWLVTPLLMAGGLFLCFEGFEKIFEKVFHRHKKSEGAKADVHVALTPVEFEKQKVRGAIRTDFILSAEIIVITLGTVATASLLHQFSVLLGISIIMTFGVYGLVAGIVKLDDLGIHLSEPTKPSWARRFGAAILSFAPLFMRFLGIAGTLAMFLVGGGILVHGLPVLHHLEESMSGLGANALSLVTGVLGGGVVFLVVSGFQLMQKIWARD